MDIDAERIGVGPQPGQQVATARVDAVEQGVEEVVEVPLGAMMKHYVARETSNGYRTVASGVSSAATAIGIGLFTRP